ncbi:diphthamide synthesis protein, partial [Nanoarchaeota archaeon]
LPNQIGLITTVQFVDQIDTIKEMLEGKGKKVFIGKSDKIPNKGQILGCNIEAATNIKDKVDSFLYIGDGMFHPKLLLLKLEKDVFRFDPYSNKFEKLNRNEIEKIKKRQKGAMLKYLSSKEIGILVSTKPGQYNLDSANKLKKKLKQEGKNAYILTADTFDFNELENFPFIECYVNTMCPRIGIDDTIRLNRPVINIDDLEV